MIVIELDGDQHAIDQAPIRDEQRDAFMEKQGWTVLRFWNNEVYQNPDGVLEAILNRAMTSQRELEVKKQQSTDSN